MGLKDGAALRDAHLITVLKAECGDRRAQGPRREPELEKPYLKRAEGSEDSVQERDWRLLFLGEVSHFTRREDVGCHLSALSSRK